MFPSWHLDWWSPLVDESSDVDEGRFPVQTLVGMIVLVMMLIFVLMLMMSMLPSWLGLAGDDGD